MSDEQKYDDEGGEEELAKVLTSLYRLAYESLIDKDIIINKEYSNIQQQLKDNTIINIIQKHSPNETKQIIPIIGELLESSNDIYGYIYDRNGINVSVEATPDNLFEYISQSKYDISLLLILKLKISNKSTKEYLSFKKDKSGGWSSHNEPTIHTLMSGRNYKLKESFKRIEILDNDTDEEKQKKEKQNSEIKESEKVYTSKLEVNKYSRQLLLFEIFLREGTSTKLTFSSGGWGTRSRSDSVFHVALQMNSMDYIELLFKYGIDLDDINVNCVTNNSGNKASSYTIWNPIHKAVERQNYEMVKLIVENGGNISNYKLKYFQHDYDPDITDNQRTLFYEICRSFDDNNKMLKFLLSNYKPGRNGDLIDVNWYNMYIGHVDNKDYNKRVEEVKEEIKKLSAEEQEYYDDAPWKDDRGEYFVPYSENVYVYDTLLHVAISQCNIELIKWLIIYGADITLCKITTPSRGSHCQGYRRSRSKMNSKERAQSMRLFYDKFMEKYKNDTLGDYEEVIDVNTLLEKATCDDDNIKIEIKKILKLNQIYFPELKDYYPNNMGDKLDVIFTSLDTHFPDVIVAIVISYFYGNIIVDKLKNQDTIVDDKPKENSE